MLTFNNEELEIIPLLLGALAVAYFGYEVDRRRRKLRSIFDVFDREESAIASALEFLVQQGQLKPYVPGTAP